MAHESGQSSTKYDWFVKYIQPYIKSGIIKKSYHLYCVWYDGFAFDLANGTGAACGFYEGIGSDKFICLFFPDARKLDNIKDYNAESQKMVPGKDYFVFQLDRDSETQNGFQPYDSDDCYQTTGMKRLPSPGCTKLIQKNGWKIPSNYPIKL